MIQDNPGLIWQLEVGIVSPGKIPGLRPGGGSASLSQNPHPVGPAASQDEAEDPSTSGGGAVRKRL